MRLKSLWHLPRFIWWAVRTFGQLRRSAGYLAFDRHATDPWTFWTLSAWTDEAAMRAYRNSGDHRAAMRVGLEFAGVVEAVRFEADSLPGWPEAMRRLHAGSGRS